MTHDPYTLPADLPVPVDDGACDHLARTLAAGRSKLRSTVGDAVRLADLESTVVFYVYPRTGRPGVDPLAGLGRRSPAPAAARRSRARSATITPSCRRSARTCSASARRRRPSSASSPTARTCRTRC